jgi:hypothetical protein
MSRFLPERGTCLSTTFRRANMCVRSLRVSHPVTAMLPLTHSRHIRLYNSQIPCHNSIRCLYAVFVRPTWVREGCDNSTLFISSYICAYILGGFWTGRAMFESWEDHPRPAIHLTTDTRAFFLSHPQAPRTDCRCLGDIPDTPDGWIDAYHARFQCHYMLCFEADIATVPSLMSEVLRSEWHQYPFNGWLT